MAYCDFTFPAVQLAFGLQLREAVLFPDVAEMPLTDSFRERMREDVPMALDMNTEKARSEFIVAPVLAEIRRTLRGRFGLFSGVQFDVDAARGLTGFCDFLFTRSPLLSILTAPVIAIAEAKNDNIRNGMGQCVASMVAAREFNAKAGNAIPVVYGVVTTGAAWKFLQLEGVDLTADLGEYQITETGRIMGVLAHILNGA